MRKYRKREHIENCLRANHIGDTLLDCVMLMNQSLPELDFSQIDMSVDFLGRKISMPLMINAMTGGVEFADDMNRALASIADKFNIPMAVGSQTIALEERTARNSFISVREAMPEGILIGNISAMVSPAQAKTLMDDISADACQIHVNPAQELAMLEGDRNFKGVADAIIRIKDALDIPVIVKEVGFGMSARTFSKLAEMGIEYADISGYGGTNFIEVEDIRNQEMDFSELYRWGIPTAMSVMECASTGKNIKIIASGGIKHAGHIASALRLGAHITGMSGEILKYMMHGGEEAAVDFLNGIAYKIKMIMMMTGSENIDALKKCDMKLLPPLSNMY